LIYELPARLVIESEFVSKPRGYSREGDIWLFEKTPTKWQRDLSVKRQLFSLENNCLCVAEEDAREEMTVSLCAIKTESNDDFDFDLCFR
jgi:hypothetical protein